MCVHGGRKLILGVTLNCSSAIFIEARTLGETQMLPIWLVLQPAYSERSHVHSLRLELQMDRHVHWHCLEPGDSNLGSHAFRANALTTEQPSWFPKRTRNKNSTTHMQFRTDWKKKWQHFKKERRTLELKSLPHPLPACMHACATHCKCVKIRGQLDEVGSLFPPLRGFWKSSSGSQASMASVTWLSRGTLLTLENVLEGPCSVHILKCLSLTVLAFRVLY